MNDSRRPPRKKNEKPITGKIFFPETEEGKAQLYNGSAVFILDVLEKKLGAERLDELMNLYEAKHREKIKYL